MITSSTTSTITSRLFAITLSMTAAMLAFASPALSAGRYDGTWSMTAVTTKGHCGTIPVGMLITKGRISSTGGSYALWPIKLSGSVSGSGAVNLKAITGPRIALGTGRFKRAGATGKWQGTGPSGRCFGYWTATRGS